MREILGGGVSTRGISKILYRAREVEYCRQEEIINEMFNSLSDENKIKINKEISGIKVIKCGGIVPSIFSNCIMQTKYDEIIEKYKRLI